MATTALEKKLLIAGEWVETGDWVEVRSPYSGDVVGRVAKAGAAEARRAVDAAEAAMREPLPAHKRAEILVRVAGQLGRRHEEVAQTISAEAGKPLKAARVEASRAMSTFTFAAVEARKLAGEMVPMDASQAGAGKLAFTLRQPIGVVGAISPFNFPLNLVAHKIAPALAAGCATVLKPASQTPFSALLLAELMAEAELPPGWLNVLVGPASEIGDVLVEDERVRAITFTGSGDVGWKLAERAPRKRVKLELGNATPVIVEADADLEDVATRLAANAFSFAGQSCISVQRVYVQRAVLRRARLAVRPEGRGARRRRPRGRGDGRRPADRPRRTRAGAGLDRRGARSRRRDPDRRRARAASELLRPTVIANAAPDLKVSCEEVFGPVCTVTRVRHARRGDRARERDALRAPGRHLHARSEGRSRRGERLEFGGVTVNEAPTFRADQMPYGGVKDSGNTREGPAYAVREFTEDRLVVIDL